MDAADREKNIAMLVRGREELLHAVAGVSEEQARTRPGPARWSVLECVEHIVLSEEAMLELLTTKSAPATSALGSSREDRILHGTTDRSRKFEAPEFARPLAGFPHSLLPSMNFAAAVHAQ
jgi:DinB superfamily